MCLSKRSATIILIVIVILNLGADKPEIVERDLVVRDRITSLELNVVWDDEFKNERFRQWIFWGDKNVIAWKWYSPYHLFQRLPKGSWELRISEDRYTRIISAGHYYQCHSNYDREVENQKDLKKESRKGLTPYNPKTPEDNANVYQNNYRDRHRKRRCRRV